jgi:hypothetical protein
MSTQFGTANEWPIAGDNSLAVCKPAAAAKAQPAPAIGLATSVTRWLITSPATNAAPTKPGK